jgi:hypothetical protein
MNIATKSLAVLIDELITADIRCWMAQDRLMDESLTEKERLASAITAQQSNRRRSDLMRAIDERLGEGASAGMEKTY